MRTNEMLEIKLEIQTQAGKNGKNISNLNIGTAINSVSEIRTVHINKGKPITIKEAIRIYLRDYRM